MKCSDYIVIPDDVIKGNLVVIEKETGFRKHSFESFSYDQLCIVITLMVDYYNKGKVDGNTERINKIKEVLYIRE